MAGKIIYWEGFECGSNGYLVSLGWQGPEGSAATVYSGYARGGNFSLRVASGRNAAPKPESGRSARSLGFHMLLPSTEQAHIHLGEAGTQTLTLAFNPTAGTVTLREGSRSGPILATASVGSIFAVWNWFSLVADPDEGIFKLWENGAEEPTIDYSGNIPEWSTYAFSSPIGGGTAYYDNVVIADGDYGRIPEMFVATAPLVADYTVQLTPSEGDDNFALVNASTAPATVATYNETETIPAKDVYALGPLGFGVDQILGVRVLALAARDGAINAGRCIVNDNGAELAGPVSGVGGAGEFVAVAQHFVPADPWDPLALSTLRVGFEFTAGDGE